MLKAQIDEIAILFKNEAEMMAFVQYAVKRGMINFDSVVRDTARGLEGVFDVHFEFLRWPERDWRIECMTVLAGHSNVHDPMRNHSLVHASFKCIDQAHYDHVCNVMAGRQKCQGAFENSYGRFAYFGAWHPYLKPRVNLRDRRTLATAG